MAVGAGLHAAAYFPAGESTLSLVGTVLGVAVPLAVYVVAVFALWGALTRSLPASHLLLLLGSAAVVAVSLLLAAAGCRSRGACWCWR